MTQYQKKVTVIVDAEQLTGTLTVAGAVVGNKGDWLVKSGSGDSFILSDAEFKAEYEAVPLHQ
jgi:hypothetical protein